MKAYIAGPMRGFPEFNFPTFDAAARILEGYGWEIISPAQMDRDEGFDAAGMTGLTLENFDVNEALRRDFAAIMTCDTIILLPGWEGSSGAGYERSVAEAIGLTILTYEEAIEQSLKMRARERKKK